MAAFGVFEHKGSVASGVVAKHLSVGRVFPSIVFIRIFAPWREVHVASVERAPIEPAGIRRMGEYASVCGIPGGPVGEVHARVVTQDATVEASLGFVAFVERNVINVLTVEGRAVVTAGVQAGRSVGVVGFPAFRVHEVAPRVVPYGVTVGVRYVIYVASVENGAHAHPHALTTGIQGLPGRRIVKLALAIVS